MVPCKYISLLILICSIICQATGWSPFTIDFETMKYEFNQKYIKKMNLELIDYNGHRAINGSFMFAEELDQMNIAAIGFIVNNKINRWLLFNVTLDSCAFFKTHVRNAPFYVRTFFKELKTFLPNLPKKCPVLKNQVLEISHLYLDAEKFPSTMPEVDISTTYSMTTRKENLFTINVTLYVAVVNSKRYREKIAKNKG